MVYGMQSMVCRVYYDMQSSMVHSMKGILWYNVYRTYQETKSLIFYLLWCINVVQIHLQVLEGKGPKSEEMRTAVAILSVKINPTQHVTW